jgi:hypothetical protein
VGVEPAALVEAVNEAQAERAAAKAELEDTRAPNTVSDAEIRSVIDSLGDVGSALWCEAGESGEPVRDR